MYVLTNSSFRRVKVDFLSSENSILIFRALLKLWKFAGGTFLVESDFLASRSLFFPFLDSHAIKTTFRVLETYF